MRLDPVFIEAETFHEQAARLGYEAHERTFCNPTPWIDLEEGERERWIEAAQAIEKFVVRTLGREGIDVKTRPERDARRKAEALGVLEGKWEGRR